MSVSLQDALKTLTTSNVLQGISVLLAYSMLDPLIEDLQDTFGKSVMYHPLSLWICIVTLVYTQTQSWSVGIIVVMMYEVIKALWRMIAPQPPVIGQVRKLLHRLQNGEKLSDSDISFLNKITPPDVHVDRR